MVKRLLKVEVADTPFKHQRGLMFRNKLRENDGMLFKFKYPQNLRFWGLNTYIPLAIAFVSSDRKIRKIDFISPCSEKVVTSDYDCELAIEANYDFFERNRINIGDQISLFEDGNNTYIKFE